MQIKIKRAATGGELLSFRGLVLFRFTESGWMICRFDEKQWATDCFRKLLPVLGSNYVCRLGDFTVTFSSGPDCFGFFAFDVEDERYAG